MGGDIGGLVGELGRGLGEPIYMVMFGVVKREGMGYMTHFLWSCGGCVYPM